MTKTVKHSLHGFLTSEIGALIVGAILLIAGASLGVAGVADGSLLALAFGAALTIVSMYVYARAFFEYRWEGIVEDVRMFHEMSKVATADYLKEVERRKK